MKYKNAHAISVCQNQRAICDNLEQVVDVDRIITYSFITAKPFLSTEDIE